MAITNSTNLAAATIAENAWVRLYDSFPLKWVTRATGARGFVQPNFTTTATGSVIAIAENAAVGNAQAWSPTTSELTGSLASYRAQVTISNELLNDSSVQNIIAQRLSGQIIETIAAKITDQIGDELIAASKYTNADYFDTGIVSRTGAAGSSEHSGFACLSNIGNQYRERAVWIFSPTGLLNFGTQEGRFTIAPIGYDSVVWQSQATNGAPSPLTGIGGGANAPVVGGGGGGAKGGAEQQASDYLKFETRADRLQLLAPAQTVIHSAYLSCPIFTSTGLDVIANGVDKTWMMLVDLSSYLLFDQPLSVTLDTESKIENNQTVVHAVYRAAGTLLEPSAGWAIVSAS